MFNENLKKLIPVNTWFGTIWGTALVGYSLLGVLAFDRFPLSYLAGLALLAYLSVRFLGPRLLSAHLLAFK